MTTPLPFRQIQEVYFLETLKTRIPGRAEDGVDLLYKKILRRIKCQNTRSKIKILELACREKIQVKYGD